MTVEVSDRAEHSHLHRCQKCGMVWGHGNMMAGDVEAHKCPKCGSVEWRVYRGGGAPVAQMPPRSAAPAAGLRWLPAIAWTLILTSLALTIIAQIIRLRGGRA